MTEDDWRWHMYDTVKGSDWLGDQDAIVCSGIVVRKPLEHGSIDKYSITCAKKRLKRFVN